MVIQSMSKQGIVDYGNSKFSIPKGKKNLFFLSPTVCSSAQPDKKISAKK